MSQKFNASCLKTLSEGIGDNLTHMFKKITSKMRGALRVFGLMSPADVLLQTDTVLGSLYTQFVLGVTSPEIIERKLASYLKKNPDVLDKIQTQVYKNVYDLSAEYLLSALDMISDIHGMDENIRVRAAELAARYRETQSDRELRQGLIDLVKSDIERTKAEIAEAPDFEEDELYDKVKYGVANESTILHEYASTMLMDTGVPSRTMFRNNQVKVIQINNFLDSKKYGQGTEWEISGGSRSIRGMGHTLEKASALGNAKTTFMNYIGKGFNIYFVLSADDDTPLAAVSVSPDGKIDAFSTDDRPINFNRDVIEKYGIPSQSLK